jgi:hypothetical protein
MTTLQYLEKTDLPKEFALRSSDGFKLFASCVLKIWGQEDISILSRLDSYDIAHVALIPSSKTISASLTRKWYGGDTVSVNWTTEGSEVMITHKNTFRTKYIPVIIFVRCTHGILPSGTDISIPKSLDILHKHSASTYDPPEVFYTDPFLSSASSSVAVSTVNSAVLPRHVKSLLIQHSIQQNESCAISGEDITESMAAVTSCGHVFDRASITRWLSAEGSRKLCPICKQECVV